MSPDPKMFGCNKPTCPGCGAVVIWGVSTSYDEKTNSDVCANCGAVVCKK